MSRPLGGFLVDACEQVCQEQKPLTDKHTEPGEQGCRFTPSKVPLPRSLVRSDLEFCPRGEWQLYSGGVLAASVSQRTRMHDDTTDKGHVLYKGVPPVPREARRSIIYPPAATPSKTANPAGVFYIAPPLPPRSRAQRSHRTPRGGPPYRVYGGESA